MFVNNFQEQKVLLETCKYSRMSERQKGRHIRSISVHFGNYGSVNSIQTHHWHTKRLYWRQKTKTDLRQIILAVLGFQMGEV